MNLLTILVIGLIALVYIWYKVRKKPEPFRSPLTTSHLLDNETGSFKPDDYLFLKHAVEEYLKQNEGKIQLRDSIYVKDMIEKCGEAALRK